MTESRLHSPLAADRIESFGVADYAYALGLKGCTTFRPNPVTDSVLTAHTVAQAPSHCCSIEREVD
jgi:ribonucleoside-diphosphate reductase alpha chain